MPLSWRRGQNPYRLSFFGILQVGAHATPGSIRFRKANLTRIINGGGEYRVEGRAVSEADLAEAEAWLLNPGSWASEVLLVHHRPATDEDRLPKLLTAVEEATAPGPRAGPFPLADLGPLASLIPPLLEADLPRPPWTDLPVPGPESTQDRNADIQFDL